MSDKDLGSFNLWDRLKEWVTPGDKERTDQSGRMSPKALLLLVAVGAGLMILGQPGANDQREADTAIAIRSASPASDDSRPRTTTERELENVLRLISGVGDVQVMIVESKTEQAVFAEEVTERTSTSASTGARGSEGESETYEENITRRPVVLRIDGGRTEEALVSHRLSPEIAGVLVVAQGAKDERVRLHMLQAVSTVLNVPAHRVQIVPMHPF